MTIAGAGRGGGAPGTLTSATASAYPPLTPLTSAPDDERAPLPPPPDDESPLPRRLALALLWAGLPLLLAHAFVPMSEFVHRGDDAFYYFKVAANYPRLGFWSFDGTEPTNGVQPLWAWMLTAVAQLAAWAGVSDPHLLARGFIAVAALVQFGSALVLFKLLSARVSSGTAFAVAGACVFSLSLVSGRLWGMESPLLALALVSVAAYHELAFRPQPTARRAATLGLLLGLTCLSRLNAGLLTPVLLAWYLLDRRAGGSFATRFRRATVAGVVVAAVVGPYLAYNLATTGALLPISGQVKAIGVARALSDWGAESRLDPRFASYIFTFWRPTAEWFIGSRLLDGLWITGLRLARDGSANWMAVSGVFGALVVGPALLGRGWWGALGARMRCLRPFTYFAIYAVIDAAVSITVYPTQRYAISRWWLVSAETVLIVLAATLAVAALAHAGARLLPVRRQRALATAGAVLLVLGSAGQMARFNWNGRVDKRDWNKSWNDESYRAAQWIAHNVPAGERVGSWNAGVLGFYSPRAVVNLDGLINNAELLPYLRDGRVHEYVLDRQLRYLSDMDDMFKRDIGGRLALTEVYSRHSPMMEQSYRIYRVDGPAAAGPDRPDAPVAVVDAARSSGTGSAGVARP